MRRRRSLTPAGNPHQQESRTHQQQMLRRDLVLRTMAHGGVRHLGAEPFLPQAQARLFSLRLGMCRRGLSTAQPVPTATPAHPLDLHVRHGEKLRCIGGEPLLLRIQ